MYTTHLALEVCDNTTSALVANALAVNREHEPAWFEQITFTLVLCVLATFVAGIMLGYRLGYARGLQDGNPLLRGPLYRWFHDLDQK